MIYPQASASLAPFVLLQCYLIWEAFPVSPNPTSEAFFFTLVYSPPRYQHLLYISGLSAYRQTSIQADRQSLPFCSGSILGCSNRTCNIVGIQDKWMEKHLYLMLSLKAKNILVYLDRAVLGGKKVVFLYYGFLKPLLSWDQFLLCHFWIVWENEYSCFYSLLQYTCSHQLTYTCIVLNKYSLF